MATSFSGEGSRREPPTTGKQLVNFNTCGYEWTAPFLAHLANLKQELPMANMFVNGSKRNEQSL
jgi:hypothetical protein